MGKKSKKEKREHPFDDLCSKDPCVFTASFLESLSSRQVGELGESVAAHYLESLGYIVVDRNYRCSEGEADIVVCDPDGDEVVLVEVKARRAISPDDVLYPEEAVNAGKRLRYRRIAANYQSEHYPIPCIRFDVIGVTMIPDYLSHVEHLYGAFDWDLGR